MVAPTHESRVSRTTTGSDREPQPIRLPTFWFASAQPDRSSSELVAHRVAGRPGRLAHDPITVGAGIAPQAHWILARPAHEQADRRHDDEEHEPEHDRAHHHRHEVAELA